jgi:hypothetical protein
LKYYDLRPLKTATCFQCLRDLSVDRLLECEKCGHYCSSCSCACPWPVSSLEEAHAVLESAAKLLNRLHEETADLRLGPVQAAEKYSQLRCKARALLQVTLRQIDAEEFVELEALIGISS